MNFRRSNRRDEPEINFVPLIDVLLVILIFVMATTTYSRFAELKINLPKADATAPANDQIKQIEVAVSAQGQYSINGEMVDAGSATALAAELRRVAAGEAEPVVVINADALSTHQSVVTLMEAARLAGYGKIAFATQREQQQ
ncbi:ExbD/TolR family protein [Chitinibacteraceae bacterium HSL-7]